MLFKKKNLPAKVKDKKLKEKKQTAKVPVASEGTVDTMPVRTMAEEVSHKVALLMGQAGTIKLTEKQKKILYAPVDEEDIEIRPDGIVYLPWSFYAKTLRKAFGNQWAQIPADIPKKEENLILRPYWLFIYGKPQAEAWGQQEYKENNPQMNYGDALEGCASNGLMRLCKKIGISSELWDKNFVKKWQDKYATKYWDPEAWNNKEKAYSGAYRWKKKKEKSSRNKQDKQPSKPMPSKPLAGSKQEIKAEIRIEEEPAKDGKITEEKVAEILQQWPVSPPAVVAEEETTHVKELSEEDKKMVAYLKRNKVSYTEKQFPYFVSMNKSHTITAGEKKELTAVLLHKSMSDAITYLKDRVQPRRKIEKWVQEQSKRKDIKLTAEVLKHITGDEKTADDRQRKAAMTIEASKGADAAKINKLLKTMLGV